MGEESIGAPKKTRIQIGRKNSFRPSPIYIYVLGIYGFFAYAKIVLHDPDGPRYVPFLHSTSSTIEAWFSMVRGANRDTPVAYRGAVGAVGALDITRAKNGSAMYEDGEVEDGESGVRIFERTFRRRDAQHDAWLEDLQKSK